MLQISRHPLLQAAQKTAFWSLVEPIYDNSVPLDPLRRFDWGALSQHYVLKRKERSLYVEDVMIQRLPECYRSVPLAQTEIDILDFIKTYDYNKCLVLSGTRGAGKTTCLHYIEAASTQVDRQAPLFFILDLRPISRSVDRALLFELLYKEVARPDRVLAPAMEAAFQEAAYNINGIVKRGTDKVPFYALCEALESLRNFKSVIVFDNVDQLPAYCMRAALQLAKETQHCTGFSCIVCLRPNALEHIKQAGSARHTYNAWIEVRPPDINAWLERLPDAMHSYMRRQQNNDDAEYKIDQKIVTPEDIVDAMRRFSRILQDRTLFADDVLEIIQAAAADDTRHLRQLIRRVLEHQSLPQSFLLPIPSGNSREHVDKKPEDHIKRDYHPLPCMIEGERLVYQGNKFVPNLLFVRQGVDAVDFILYHRILTLLADADVVYFTDLLLWCELLGFERDICISALTLLYETLLIRTTDTVVVDYENPPEGIFLTDAGKIYINHLLSNPDYLTTVVLDVPLEHRRAISALSGAAGAGRLYLGFAERIDSLMEYVDEVFRQEQNQIRSLPKLPPSAALRRVADALRKGGLFCEKLSNALELIKKRGANSSSTAVREMIPAINGKIEALTSYVQRARQLLENVVLRGGKYRRVPHDTFAHAIPEADLEVRWHDLGDNVHITFRSQKRPSIEDDKRLYMAVVEFANSRNGKRMHFCRALYSQKDFFEATAIAENISASDLEVTTGQVVWLERTLAAHRTSGRQAGTTLGLLTPEPRGGSLVLRLHVFGQNFEKPKVIGNCADVSRLKAQSARLLKKVGLEACSPQSQLSRASLRVAGSTLGRDLFSPEGQNAISTVLLGLGVIIVFVTEEVWDIPWEWLRVTPQEPGEDQPMIAEVCDVVRWPSAAVDFLHRQRELDSKLLERGRGTMCTVGLPITPDTPWRIDVPSSYEELVAAAREHDTIHIVGHFDEQASGATVEESVIKIDAGTTDQTFVLRLEDMLAEPLCKSSGSIVISACDSALARPGANIPANICRQYGIQVWAAAVSILKSHVDYVDRQIANIGNTGNLPEFFGHLRSNNGIGGVYVRYGI